MPARTLRLDDRLPEPIAETYESLVVRLEVPREFPADALAEAEQVVREGYDTSLSHRDLTDVEFVTIDPPGSMDLDQAMHIAREGSGFLVQYAIADVAAWVRPGGALDTEAHRRGQTYYAPHERYGLYPPALSEGAASLLDDGTARPAQVWRLELDEDGEVTGASVERALVRSRARLNYADVQVDIDRGTAAPTLMLLKEVGRLRHLVEIARGGVSLQLPEQEVEVESDTWVLRHRSGLPDEDWNAQISLMTGFSAASMMLEGGVGILRTLPPAEPGTIKTLRRVARSLGLPWPQRLGYAEFIQSLNPALPQDQAMMMAAVRLFRGAGYTVVEPGLKPEQTVHGALAASYAHTTAPLRRLVDRYVGETCLALSAGREVPEWVLAALPDLPKTMNESDRRAKAFERAVTDLVEALVLQPRIGETFRGVVLSVDAKRPGQGIVSLTDPAVEAPVSGRVELGEEVTVELVSVDLEAGKVQFETR